MSDQLQTTRDRWTPPVGTPDQTDEDRTGPPSSTHDSTAQDSADVEQPADDGTVYRSAGHDSAVDQPDVHDPVAAGTADLDHTDPDPAVGVASVPDAETVDRGASETADVAVQDDVRTETPDEAYDLDGHPAEVEEREAARDHDGVPEMTDTRGPVDVDERADVAGGEAPTVPAPTGDAALPAVTGAGETLPGDLPEQPGLALFDSETTGGFRDRWHELQLRFVDDPVVAERQAVALVDEVVTALRDAVDRQRAALHDWQAGEGADAHSGDTERMRVAVRRYRDFLDRLLGV